MVVLCLPRVFSPCLTVAYEPAGTYEGLQEAMGSVKTRGGDIKPY